MNKSLALLLSVGATMLTATAEPSLTIYNQNFAVVRDTVPLDLKAGINDVLFIETTAHLEPDSVILRDRSRPPKKRRKLPPTHPHPRFERFE